MDDREVNSKTENREAIALESESMGSAHRVEVEVFDLDISTFDSGPHHTLHSTELDPILGNFFEENFQSSGSGQETLVSLKESSSKYITDTAPVLQGIGSSIVSLPTSYVACATFALTTALSAKNIVQGWLRSAEKSGEESSSPTREGVIGLVSEVLQSPGVVPIVQTAAYVVAALEAPFIGEGSLELNLTKSAIFVAFAIGAIAAARIANRDYQPPEREKTAFEHGFEERWDQVSSRVKTVLQNPGAMFCAGNLALISLEYNFSALAASGPTMWAAFGVGLGAAAIGLWRGFSPLFGNRVEESGDAAIAGGLGDIFLGLTTYSLGNPYTGVATIFWGASNILYGVKIKPNTISDLKELLTA